MNSNFCESWQKVGVANGMIKCSLREVMRSECFFREFQTGNLAPLNPVVDRFMFFRTSIAQHLHLCPQYPQFLDQRRCSKRQSARLLTFQDPQKSAHVTVKTFQAHSLLEIGNFPPSGWRLVQTRQACGLQPWITLLSASWRFSLQRWCNVKAL
jgi:hypothetical protein